MRWQVGTRVLGRYDVTHPAAHVRDGRRVVRGRDGVTGADVALKVAPAGTARREVTALMVARFPGVVPLLDEGTVGAEQVIVMGWVDGRPFPGVTGPVPWERLERPTLALLDTLDRLHGAGVVHRDLKPTNVLVAEDGRPTVLDLGIALGAGVGFRSEVSDGGGTLRYVAPEQLLEDDVDPRSDLYAVGVMVYEALTGHLPHDSPDLVGARLSTPPIPVGRRTAIDPAVGRAIDAMLARRPADRVEDARTAARALGGSRRRMRLPPGRPSRRALEAALGGPERILHVPSRAAALLWSTAGPGRRTLEAELGRWERAGIVDDRLRVDPVRLRERLGVERGLRHLRGLLAAPGADGATIAAREAGQLARDGAYEAAIGVLRAALLTARRDPAAVARLLRVWEECAHAIGTPTALEDLATMVRRAEDPSLDGMLRTAEAGLLVARGALARAAEALADTDSFAAHVVRNHLGRLASPAEHEQAVLGLERFARRSGDGELRAMALNARGLWLYRTSRFAEAARAHTDAVGALGPGRALAARLNAATALLEIPDPVSAAPILTAVIDTARASGHELHEARAEVLLRACEYRTGVQRAPDRALVETLEGAGWLPLAALAALVEAAVAWRSGDDVDAAALAGRSEALSVRSGRAAIALLAAALHAACTGAPAERVRELRAACGAGHPPGIVAQALALLARAAPPSARPELSAAASAAAPWRTNLDRRREVLAPVEIVHDRATLR